MWFFYFARHRYDLCIESVYYIVLCVRTVDYKLVGMREMLKHFAFIFIFEVLRTLKMAWNTFPPPALIVSL